MLSLDLFNTKYERNLREGAVDDLEARRIDDLNMRMSELLDRAKESHYKNNPEGLAGLKREYQRFKDERDSYYKVREGSVTPTATGLRHQAKPGTYGGYEPEADPLARLDKQGVNRADKALGVKFNREKKYQGGVDVDEGGIPGSVPTEKIPGKEDLLKGKGRTYYEGEEGEWSKEGPWTKTPKNKAGKPVDPRGEVAHLSDVARRKAERDANMRLQIKREIAADRIQNKIQNAITQKKNSKQVAEHGGGIGPRQHWQDLVPEQSNTDGDDWYDDEDQETELRSGDYVRDTMDGEHGEVFRMQGDPYERRVRILDRDGKGWYIEPSRLARVDPTDPDIQRYFGKNRQRDMDEAVDEKGALKSAQAAAKFIIRNLDDRAALKDYSMHFWSPEKFYQGATMAMRGAGIDEIVRQITQDRPAQFESDVSEGWSDRALAQRTGQPRTPYAVYIKGKKWKDFENDDLARAVMNKLKAKFAADGRDPETITIAPTDIPEGVAEAEKKGLYYYVNKRKKAGTSRDADSPKAPTAQAWKDAAKTAKKEDIEEEKTRLDPKCWTGKKIGNPKTKVKGGVRVNNCVPAESINEVKDTEAVEQAILKRIMVSHKDLLMTYGPEKIMSAAGDVAYNVGDVGEIGSSDVGGWVRQVMQILGATT